MKRLFITALLAVAVCNAMAQAPKTPTPQKAEAPAPPQFAPDYSKTIEVKLNIPLWQANGYLFVLQNPGYASSKLTGDVITQISNGAAEFGKSIATAVGPAFDAALKAQHDKFVADTTKVKQPVTTPKKH